MMAVISRLHGGDLAVRVVGAAQLQDEREALIGARGRAEEAHVGHRAERRERRARRGGDARARHG